MKWPTGFRMAYRIGAVLLLTFALVYGLTVPLPRLVNLGQTSRNLFYHVPMWFSMYLMMAVSLWGSLLYLRKGLAADDRLAAEAARVGVFFGLLGLVTGILWSRVTWGSLLPDSNFSAWWSWDPKQTFALAAVLVYAAYFLLRSSVDDDSKRARLAAVYNLFAAASLVPLTLIIPRALGGLHPGGSDGSPVFEAKDVSNEYRLVFYPAILGFMCLGLWLTELRVRMQALSDLHRQRLANS